MTMRLKSHSRSYCTCMDMMQSATLSMSPLFTTSHQTTITTVTMETAITPISVMAAPVTSLTMSITIVNVMMAIIMGCTAMIIADGK